MKYSWLAGDDRQPYVERDGQLVARKDAESEKAFQARVIELAQWLKWRHFHAFDSRRSPEGFPDLVLVRPPRLVVLELKSATGRLSDAQAGWLRELLAVPGVEGGVFRPDDWDRLGDLLR